MSWEAWGWQRVGRDSTDQLDNMEIAGDGPEVFDCQLKMVTTWWRRWNPEEKRQFLQELSVSWPDVGEHLRRRGILL